MRADRRERARQQVGHALRGEDRDRTDDEDHRDELEPGREPAALRFAVGDRCGSTGDAAFDALLALDPAAAGAEPAPLQAEERVAVARAAADAARRSARKGSKRSATNTAPASRSSHAPA